MAKPKKMFERFEMQLDADTLKRLDHLAQKSAQSKAEVLRRLVRRANVADVI